MIKLFIIYAIIGELLTYGISMVITINFMIKYGCDSLEYIDELLSGIGDKSSFTMITSLMIWPVIIIRFIDVYNYLDSALAERYL